MIIMVKLFNFQNFLFIFLLSEISLFVYAASKKGINLKRTVGIPALKKSKKSEESTTSTWEKSKPYYDPEAYHLHYDLKINCLKQAFGKTEENYYEYVKNKNKVKTPEKVFEVSKMYAFEETYNAVQNLSVEQLLNCEIYLKDDNTTTIERVKQENWYSALMSDMFDHHRGLYISTQNNSGLLIDPASNKKKNYLKQFRFIGKMLALGIRKKKLRPDSVQLGRIFLKTILRRQIYLIDVEAADPKFYKELMRVKKNPKKHVFTLDSIPLKDNGAQIRVTVESVKEYMDRAIQYKYVNSVSKQIKAFLDGFNKVIPLQLLNHWKPSDLEIRFYGVPKYFDLEDWHNKTEIISEPKDRYANSLVDKFYKIIKDWLDSRQRIKLLYFIRGTTRFEVGRNGKFVGEKFFEIYANLDEKGNRIVRGNREPLVLPWTNITAKRLHLLDGPIVDLREKLEEAIEYSEPF